jgi:hypothetical protein
MWQELDRATLLMHTEQRQRQWVPSSGLRSLGALKYQMRLFVASMLEYCMAQIEGPLWLEAESAMRTSCDVASFRLAHLTYLDTIVSRLFLGSKVWNGLRQILGEAC